MRRLLKWFVPKAWEDGVASCNELGKELIACRQVEKMLDAGCGDGALTIEFARSVGAREVHGIDYVEEALEKATARGIKCVKGDLDQKWEQEDAYFDLVLSSQNLEHVHNTRLYLEEAYRCLKPGGQFLVLTENLSSWGNIGALVMGWQPFSATHINGWDLGNPLIWNIEELSRDCSRERLQSTGISGTAGHVRVLAYAGLRDLLIKVGFAGVRVYTRGYLPFWGPIADLLCGVDPRHGHFLVATGFRPPGA